jgi:hypothetical protein
VRTIADSGIRTACGGNHRQRKRELEQVALPLYTPEDLPTLALAMDPNLAGSPDPELWLGSNLAVRSIGTPIRRLSSGGIFL